MTPMRRTVCLCIIVVGCAGGLAGIVTSTRAAVASAAAADWHDAIVKAQAVRARLANLPVTTSGPPQPDRIATLARSLLVSAGVGQEALAGIQPLGDVPLPGGSWHRQQVLLQLRGLSSQQAAAIVDAVARTDPAWSVGSIQLSHAGTGDRYDAGLSLTTLYPAQP